MISLFRDFTKSWIFKALMVLLVASFAIFGLHDVFTNAGTNEVIKAGKRSVSATDFKSRFEQIKQDQMQKTGQAPTNDEFVASGDHVRMLNQMADETAFSAWLDSIGVKASSKLIVEKIATIPAFFNQVTGRFDKDAYRKRLADNGMTEHALETDISDQVSGQQYFYGAIAGLKAPRIYAATEAAYNLQNRDVSMTVISSRDLPPPPMPTDAEIAAFYKEHLPQLKMPEMRQASVVQVSPAEYISTIVVDEEALKKVYQSQLTNLTTPETRSFTQITAPNASAAAAISSALKAGQDPAAVAKAHKGQVIVYDQKAKLAVADSKVGDAAFAMKTGEVSGAVQGDLAFAVIKMGEIKIGSVPSYESVRQKLADDYKAEKAKDKVNEIVHKFQDAHEAGEDFNATAAKLGLKVVALPLMTTDGKSPQIDARTGKPADYSAFPVLVKDIFDLPAGGTSDVEELGEGQYFALKLNVLKPAGAPPLAEVKGELVNYWRAGKVSEAVTAKADEVMKRLDKGEALSAVAASLNLKVQPLANLNRVTAQQMNLPAMLASRIFVTKAGDHFSAQINQENVVVGHIDAVRQADIKMAGMMSTAMRTQMSQAMTNDMVEVTRAAARAAVKAQIYPTVAVQALGVTPPDPKEKPADGKKKS